MSGKLKLEIDDLNKLWGEIVFKLSIYEIILSREIFEYLLDDLM